MLGPWFSLATDRGAGELFQYGKEAVLIGAGVVLFRRSRQWLYLALAALVAGLLLDDAFQFHERAGEALARAWSLPGGDAVRPQDLGEIAALALWVGPVVALAGLAYLRASAEARAHARAFGVGIALLAAFGVGVDLLHRTVAGVWGLDFALASLEEGGELAVMSVIVAAAVRVAAGPRAGRRPSRWRRAPAGAPRATRR